VDCIVLAVKPAAAGPALSNLPATLLQKAVVISVAAGVTLATLRAAAGHACPVVRVMPNTPMLLGAGCTGLYAGDDLPGARRQAITRLFEAVGSAHWVQSEPQLDAVTAISGSGPAYYHLFSEALAAAGQALGLDAELARRLAVDTAFGAATQQRQPQADLAQLRRAITSPNGTTAAAIEVFEQDQALRTLVQTAARAAAQRAEALSRGE
jgi:pyrroline-5-carboxylate reductase